MAKFTNTLCAKTKYGLNFVRVPAFIFAAAPRAKSARFCRYGRVFGNIIG
jgi:hypothetical protein